MASLIHEPSRPRKPWRVSWIERRQRRTRRFATRREAERFVGELATGQRRTRAGRLTLTDWIVAWIRSHGPEWEPRTRRDRGSYADRLILPHLGGMRLHEIGRLDVRQWRADLLRGGTTPHVANRAVSVLSAALGAAVDDELIAANPCRGLSRLPEGPKRREPATLAEVERARLALAHLYDPTGRRPPRVNPRVERDRAAVSLLAYAGLRPSELAALRWADVQDATLVVRAARGEGRDKATKTGSVRTVPLVRPLREDLEALEHNGPLVLGRLDVPNWRGRVWAPACAQVGVERTPYALRHTFASLLIAEGRPPHEVARLLGHSTPALTLSTYGHLFDEAQLRDAESMEDAAARARHEAASISRTAAEATPRGGPGRRRGGAGRGGAAVGRSSGAIR